MDRRTTRWWPDAGVAAVLAALGLTELWLPLESLAGEGSEVVDTLGVLWFNLHLSQRRRRPWLALAGFAVWPIVGALQGAEVHLMFFGQFVPALVLTYSLARYAEGPLRWASVVAAIAFVALADLFIPLLRQPSELIFHWGSMALAYGLGFALRVAEEKAAAEAVRAHRAEAEGRERALTAVAEERARIARELHDIVAHSVGVIVVQAGAAEQIAEEDPAFARRALGTIRVTGAGALAEMRRLVTMLRDPETGGELAPQPGIAALTELLDTAHSAGLAVELSISGDRPALPAGLDLTAYRIIQEALTNVRRHSQASSASVELRFGQDAVEIIVADPGPAKPLNGATPGHGLIGMRERAALFGGHVEADDAGPGFRVRAVLPLEPS